MEKKFIRPDLSKLSGREAFIEQSEELFHMIRGKRILVTGGGGSIGSELCRQIAAHSPECLIIMDIYENNAYEIQQEISRHFPELRLYTVIGSIRDAGKLREVFGKFRPEIVYHAAAHKHVPLMENDPCEAVKNNVFGTYKTAYYAMVNGCKRFVLVSTDKAVNPTNVMGATKRLCEMIIQSFDYMVRNRTPEKMPELYTHAGWLSAKDQSASSIVKNIQTEFVAVRFGNVLGSSGSVIPLFQEQIEEGGPVTVTHPEIIRYFMEIPEAVNLILQAGLYARGGEIFVLDMGEPVKIDTLARNLIRMYGLEPDKDIKITYTGLRAGEKLYEEKLMAEEGICKTPNNQIFIGKPLPFDIGDFLENLKILEQMSYDNSMEIKDFLQKIVPTYRPM
ncbi:MAG: polysaccharide biosynthesis protein [Candidatus Limivivens sp.]|nr:polysaccharide biosynthesis protein [Candidatus Limivivens sp.]